MSVLQPVLRIKDLEAGYGKLQILHGLTMNVADAAITTIIGANGAGKSTLLKAVFGLVDINGGEIFYRDREITAMTSRERIDQGISLVPQGRCNFPLMSVAENLRLGGMTRKLPKKQINEEIERLVERFPSLAERWRIAAGNLSGGEQQILEMAMVLLNRPKLLLLDEPSLGLSPKAMGMVFDETIRLAEDGVCVLMVEQNANQALKKSHFAVVLELGKMGLEGTAEEVLNHPRIRRHFLGL
ncbi:ABC transporter ATP-binding protein [bacterium]|nr:ABC transporter ATP-binding protein [bacterium]